MQSGLLAYHRNHIPSNFQKMTYSNSLYFKFFLIEILFLTNIFLISEISVESYARLPLASNGYFYLPMGKGQPQFYFTSPLIYCDSVSFCFPQKVFLLTPPEDHALTFNGRPASVVDPFSTGNVKESHNIGMEGSLITRHTHTKKR